MLILIQKIISLIMTIFLNSQAHSAIVDDPKGESLPSRYDKIRGC
ncbi:hypothetical protein Dacsa_3398 [Dactylococcopsis salina PCC 8305]|uniref:Uncharacterized protein n=1 Tax=Dactylococcopsis salina (strain PCC 8305) TaxID=13035 RepID=K9YY69_DACS8|nr:hypothetical protein Dacsa_3398 [Dactylococcopsis salina PCC 8305]